MNVEQPIFIVGAGRSGSTVFHQMFCEHPGVAWLSSRLSSRHPARTDRNGTLMKAIDWPLVGNFIKHRFWPGEAYDFWDYQFPGFSLPCRDLVRDDVTLRTKKRAHKAIGQALTQRRSRAMIKITGWNRMRFLDEIFPDAKFVHVRRDARGVINSIINVDFWWGWRGPQNWRWGELNAEHAALWDRFDRSFIALAGIGLEIMNNALQEAKQDIDPARFVEIDYEDLCARPTEVFRDVVDFCELDWTLGFERTVRNWPLESSNFKWQEELTPRQKEIVEFFGQRIDFNAAPPLNRVPQPAS